eukprot:g3324.t1
MPLSPEYSFTQTDTTVSLHVSLKGTPKRKVDIYIADVFVKVNFAPYLLQLDLCEPVSLDKPVARFDQRDGKLHIVLLKATPGTWESLKFTPPQAASSSEKRKILSERRGASMERRAKYDDEVRELVKERRFKNEKMTLRRQMAVEEDERQHIEELKAEEKEDAERAVYEKFNQLQKEQAAQRDKKKKKKEETVRNKASGKEAMKKDKDEAASVVNAKEAVFESPAAKARAEKAAAAAEKALADEAAEAREAKKARAFDQGGIWSDSEEDEDVAGTDAGTMAEMEDEDDLEFVPDPRSSSTIKIGFTERFFPTPARESKLQEENEWLAKNGAHVGKRWGQPRQKGDSSDTRDISERDPMWLKGKGDDFYRGKDFHSAVNAYTAAIGASDPEGEPALLAALGNRAACYLRMGKHSLCVDDCGRVLELLPPVPADAASGKLHPMALAKCQLGPRARILVRRGAACCELGDYGAAVRDYEEAISILLLDQQALTGAPAGMQLPPEQIERAKQQIHALHNDLGRIRALAECAQLKEAGDAALRRKDVDQAIQSYDKVLDLDPSFVAALSNRAAARLMQGSWKECRRDCSLALGYLRKSVSAGNTSAGQGSSLGSVPKSGSTRHTGFMVKTLARRSLAYCKLGIFSKAIRDLEEAIPLEDADKVGKLTSDLERLRAQFAENGDLACEEEENDEEESEPQEIGASSQDASASDAGTSTEISPPVKAPGCQGTVYTILAQGRPEEGILKRGAKAKMHAIGVLKDTGNQFWSTHDSGTPFEFSAGTGSVIKGWDQGCLGMAVGEKRRITVPGAEGYGSEGFPQWSIPPNATLEFTVELISC